MLDRAAGPAGRTVIPQTGSTACAPAAAPPSALRRNSRSAHGRAPRRRRRPPGRRPRAEARSWTSSARIATAISRCVVRPRSSPAGTRTRSSCLRTRPRVRPGSPARASPRRARPDQPEVGGPGAHRLLHGLLVAVSLGCHHDHGALGRVGRGEVLPGHQRGAPAERLGQVGQRLRHRRAADDDQVRGRHAPARCTPPARPRSGRRWARRSSRPAPPRRTGPGCRAAAAAARRRRSPRRASRMTAGSAQAPPIQP